MNNMVFEQLNGIRFQYNKYYYKFIHIQSTRFSYELLVYTSESLFLVFEILKLKEKGK